MYRNTQITPWFFVLHRVSPGVTFNGNQLYALRPAV